MTDFLTATHAARFILAAILGLALLISWLSARAIDRWDHADDQRDGRALVERGERARTPQVSNHTPKEETE